LNDIAERPVPGPNNTGTDIAGEAELAILIIMAEADERVSGQRLGSPLPEIVWKQEVACARPGAAVIAIGQGT